MYCHYPDDFPYFAAAYGEFKGCVSFIMGNFTLFNFCISGTVAYIDDQMQKKLKQLGLDLKEGHDYLVQDLPSRLNNNLQSIITAAKEIKL